MSTRTLRPALLAALLLAVCALPACWGQSIRASLVKPTAGYVRLNEPVILSFNQKLDPKSVRLGVIPSTEVTVETKGTRVVVTPPAGGWKPNQTYSLDLHSVSSADHSLSLSNWKTTFATQPLVGIAGFLVDGAPVSTVGGTSITMSPFSKVTITFTAPMTIASAPPTVNGTPLPAAQVAWAPDGKSVDLAGAFSPYASYQFGVGGKPVTATGDVASDLTPLTISTLGIEPSNSSSGIAPGYKTLPALLVVIDDAGDARPQAGLQTADMAFEYISEYNISRFTLLYFNQPPSTIGPVRSCRMINAFLLEAFHGIQMCSGGSVGTLHFLYGTPLLNTNINDFDTGNHYFRVGYKAAPHNLYTDGGRALRLRTEEPIGGGPYLIDPSHPDNGLGTLADAPSIPLHHVSYTYDGGCSCYRPFDNGTPRVDTDSGGAQIGVKNVVVMHVQFRDAGWVEDENGGAHSVWYYMNGSGAAEIWSDGKLIQGQWHEGGADQDYYQNTTQPLYFTDQSGNLVRLNTGLTWIHVVGNGQTS